MHEELRETRKQLLECLRLQMDLRMEDLNTHEAGMVTDMIKDLAEAEYYETVLEAMAEGEDENDRPGYTPRKRRENRRFKPYVDQEPYVSEMLKETRTPYGRAWDEYEGAKRYYTETKNPSLKSEMDARATEHIGNSLVTLREIWRDADPALRQRMKADLTNLVNEMVL